MENIFKMNNLLTGVRLRDSEACQEMGKTSRLFFHTPMRWVQASHSLMHRYMKHLLLTT
ncbi:hypothetical protein H1P_3960002 [Hyella patelloides LEGE 07179]|uniref:Uncharacterized protein n=2 Tax=Hyella TaxID=945733 RepID=A0A563VX84_9CYAN|nr:hypothetical protein H1P_3960002 [Hyella patelloides LEGE 07179]